MILDFFTGFDTEEEQARQNALDAQLRKENEKDRDARGEDWFAQAQHNAAAGAINVAQNVRGAFFGDDTEEEESSYSAPAPDRTSLFVVVGVFAWLLFFKK